jgi:hypothetical protein
MPFYFMLYVKDGERKLSGEGNGAKEATAAAFEDIKLLVESETAIAILIGETIEANGTE